MRLAETVLRALVHGAPDQHGVAQTGVDQGHGVRDGRHGGGAAAGNAAGVGQVLHAEAAAQADLVAVVDGEGDHAVHFGRVDAGVVERGLGAFRGELQLAAAGGLGEFRGADAGDGGILESTCHFLVLPYLARGRNTGTL